MKEHAGFVYRRMSGLIGNYESLTAFSIFLFWKTIVIFTLSGDLEDGSVIDLMFKMEASSLIKIEQPRESID